MKLLHKLDKEGEFMEYVLGFDGGGTKTDLVVTDLFGNELFAMRGNASNPKSISFDTALHHLIELLDRLYEDGHFQPNQCRGICLGISGIYNELEIRRVTERFTDYYLQRGHQLLVRITNDAEIALTAGLGQPSGIIAIAGTGAIIFGATPDGRQFRTGGWGHLLGDKGSGYEIGLQTMQAIMLSFDGVLPPTRITELVLEKYDWSSPDQLRTYIYQPHISKQNIAEFAEICIQAAEGGDSAARQIIERNAGDLASLTVALRAKDPWFSESPIAVTGSVFRYSPIFLNTFIEHLQKTGWRATVIPSEQKPVLGAAMLALDKLSRSH
jgi:N-acetylglucosamine kinase-like BadF-type ATPase